MARADDFGKSDRTFITHTHLGEFINFNDTVLCYDLNQTTIQELEDYDNGHKHALPDVVIVKKSFPKVRKRQANRIWKLNRLDMEKQGDNDRWEDGKKKKQRQGAVADAKKDFAEFMDEIEEDPEMRANINLYKVN